jgi:probable DNA metabolism protein
MLRVPVSPTFGAWREAARAALAAGYRPEQIDLQDMTIPSSMELGLAIDIAPSGPPIAEPHVSKAFLDAAGLAAVHRDPQRWNLLYRLLWRMQQERGLMHIEIDDDVAALRQLTTQVQRDIHKMHAFVRFRKVTAPDGGAVEQYVAWHRPDHRILPLAAPFFAERFAVMHWAILTPDASVVWDPVEKRLKYGDGVPREHAPQEDEVEELWKSYYASIFNPARVNPETMRSEMPVRYWQNLPEAAVIPHLIQKAESRVGTMISVQQEKTTASPFVPAQHTLPALRRALSKCEGCDLYRCATQVVPGAGDGRAHLVLVGEQPGDQEDLAGEPFVGPAGSVLRKALEELRIDPASVYMTNAVKHFKFVQRGKKRLHENPRMSEINACRPWLLAELDAIKPRVVVCLGASASKSLLGGTFALMKSRGQVQESPFAQKVIATVHPSAILRARDHESRDQLLGFLKDDLAVAYKLAQKAS